MKSEIVIKVCSMLHQNNFNCLIFGDAVRCYFNSGNIKKYSILTDAKKSKINEIFYSYEILKSSFRKCKLLIDGKIFVFNYSENPIRIKRDFNYNLVMYNPLKDKLYDCNNALEELKKSKLVISTNLITKSIIINYFILFPSYKSTDRESLMKCLNNIQLIQGCKVKFNSKLIQIFEEPNYIDILLFMNKYRIFDIVYGFETNKNSEMIETYLKTLPDVTSFSTKYTLLIFLLCKNIKKNEFNMLQNYNDRIYFLIKYMVLISRIPTKRSINDFWYCTTINEFMEFYILISIIKNLINFDHNLYLHISNLAFMNIKDFPITRNDLLRYNVNDILIDKTILILKDRWTNSYGNISKENLLRGM